MEGNLTHLVGAAPLDALRARGENAKGRTITSTIDTAIISGPDVRAPQTRGVPPLERIDGEPQFRFFVAGARASGKTVFLASLHHELAVAGNRSHFYGRLTSGADDRYLRAKFNVIRDPEQSWPPGDAVATDYVFRCFHSSTNVDQTFPLFRFHYTDFPGGNLTHPNADQALDVRSATLNAHSVVFLLDGRKILDAINGRSTTGFSINDDLDVISELATDCVFRPTQFVITKWDIFAGHSLQEVRRCLLEHSRFSAIVKMRREAHKPTYLIPVSAVGDDFARYDPASNAMVKKPNAVPRPYNLDVTLAFAVTDTLLNSFKAPLTNRDLFWFNLLKALVGSACAIKWMAGAGTIISSDPWVMAMMVALDRASDRITDLVNRLESETRERLSQIKDGNSALDKITEIQHLLAANFLSRFPSANLLHLMEGDP